MPVYLIVETKEIIDKAKYCEYIHKVPKTIEKFKGEYLVRGPQIKVISGNWSPTRLIIVKFKSMEILNAWYNSSEYCTLASLRKQSAKTNAVVVEGL